MTVIKRKLTILISYHTFSSTKCTCDAIFLLKNGKFVRSVTREDFDELEEEMKAFSIGDSMEKLGLK